MPLPRLVAQALSADPLAPVPGAPAFDKVCEGSKHHSPRPLLLHHVLLPSGRYVWLCGVCEDNLAVLVHLMTAADGALSWEQRREFGNEIRALAEEKEPAGV